MVVFFFLWQSHVVVAGIGSVGSWAVEASLIRVAPQGAWLLCAVMRPAKAVRPGRLRFGAGGDLLASTGSCTRVMVADGVRRLRFSGHRHGRNGAC